MKQQSFSANTTILMTSTSLPYQQVSHFFAAPPSDVVQFLLHMFQTPQRLDACPQGVYQLIAADQATQKALGTGIEAGTWNGRQRTSQQIPCSRDLGLPDINAATHLRFKLCPRSSAVAVAQAGSEPLAVIYIDIMPLAMGSLLQVQTMQQGVNATTFIDAWTHQLVQWSAACQSLSPPRERHVATAQWQ